MRMMDVSTLGSYLFSLISIHLRPHFSFNNVQSWMTCYSVQSWMTCNRLRLNGSKTEFIWLGSSRRLPRCSFGPLVIGGIIVHPASSVSDLEVVLDPSLSFVNHVANLTGVAFYHIRQLRSIRRSLTTDSCHSLVRALHDYLEA